MPQGFQPLLVAQGIHALPEAVMLVGHHLMSLYKLVHRLLLQHDIALQIIKNFRLHDHETAVDIAYIITALLPKGINLPAIHLQIAKAAFRLGGGNGADFP